MDLNVIVAMQRECRGIGVGNQLPWSYPSDLKRFAKLTKGKGKNAVIMGRKTWESLPIHPLPRRKNIVLSTTLTRHDITLKGDELYFSNLEDALCLCKEREFDQVWIIGGESIYRKVIKEKLAKRLFITLINDKRDDFDAFFPTIPSDYELVSHEAALDGNRTIYYQIYERKTN